MSHLTLISDETKSVMFVTDSPSTLAPEVQDRLYDWIEQVLSTNNSYIVVDRKSLKHSTFRHARKSGTVIIALGEKAGITLRGVPHFKLPHPGYYSDPKLVFNKLAACTEYIKEKTSG